MGFSFTNIFNFLSSIINLISENNSVENKSLNNVFRSLLSILEFYLYSNKIK